MKKFLTLFLLSFLLLVDKTFSQTVFPVPFYKMTTFETSQYKSLRYGGGSTFYRMSFRLLLPKGYDSSNVSTTTYPMVVMLHGFGESAQGRVPYNTGVPYKDQRLNNNDHQLRHHGYDYLVAVNNGKWPGFVLFPQNVDGEWSPAYIDDMVAIVKHLCTKLKIDPNKIHITGLSSGGQGVWDAIQRHTNVFASAISYSGIKTTAEINGPRIAHIPFWYFQGGLDTAPSPSNAAPSIQALRNAGGTPKYTLYPDSDHGTWQQAINEPDLFPYLKRYSKLSIHPYFGKTQFKINETVNVRLGISPDFAAYEWRKDGVLITGANSNEIIAASAGSFTVRFKRVNSDWTAWSDPLIINQETAPVIREQPVNITRALGQTVSFSVIATGAAPMTFQWRKNGINISGATSNTYIINSVLESDEASYDVVITNALGTATSNNVFLTVDEGYFVTINTPVVDTKYRIGQIISYSGSFTDGQNGTSNVVKWTLRFHTPSGIFGVWERTGIAGGTITIPQSAEKSSNVFYRLTLRATDANGRETVVFRDITPTLVTVTLTTDPPGLKIYLDTLTKVGPYLFTAVVGSERTLSTQANQILDSMKYKFTEWGHGGALTQKVTFADAGSLIYTAKFVKDTVTDPLSVHLNIGKEVRIDENLKVYPNPAVNHLYLDVKAERGEKLIMGIINSMGISFMSSAVTADFQGINSFDVDVSSLKGNSYILKVQKGKGVYFRHFFVMR